MAQVVARLPSKHEALNSNPNIGKKKMLLDIRVQKAWLFPLCLPFNPSFTIY
jgi:hypothetical protein